MLLTPVPFIKSIDILGYDKILHFPTSAAFSYPPADLVPFEAYQGKGVYVPLALTAEDDLLGSELSGSGTLEPLVEIDGEGILTVELKVDAKARLARTGIVRVPAEDAWRLGQDDSFSEPEGTCRGFRNVTGLQHDLSSEVHLRGNSKMGRTEKGDWSTPSEEEESSGFIRDMVETMKAYWVKVMEIANAFLHYLEHYQIFTAEETYLRESLTTAIEISKTMLRQIKIAQVLCNTLPGNVAYDSWHAYALQAWVHLPAMAEEWELNGDMMKLKIEGTFTPAREESMTRNMESVPLNGDQVVVTEEPRGAEDGGGVRWEPEAEEAEKDGHPVIKETAGWDHVSVLDTLSAAIGTDASGYTVTARRETSLYTLTGLSLQQPDSVPRTRLDARFAAYARTQRTQADVGGDDDDDDDNLLWLTLALAPDSLDGTDTDESTEHDGPGSSRTEERVVALVDVRGRGSELAQQMDKAQAVGMRMRAGLICIGKGEEATWIVDLLEEVVPRF
ncbi:hypothetical protein QFC19_008273 [Naganishia cerealis]|uniref:Uncharacterized protein n=1 Tax=Naganishia cerealis TaxID=610337 RepID=A0ACC2V3L2_9TREE|nr:hypothetical protein QFC19_008273 [Naganishia cerealis]